ncbi:hypothetical protein P1X15_16965 [Runella sp. MFBS21]|nr:hypothetical protein [Runella sp. MFBS21]MDF7819311.1 hypothetical protein [Runella sp. MFBS21]
MNIVFQSTTNFSFKNTRGFSHHSPPLLITTFKKSSQKLLPSGTSSF